MTEITVEVNTTETIYKRGYITVPLTKTATLPDIRSFLDTNPEYMERLMQYEEKTVQIEKIRTVKEPSLEEQATRLEQAQVAWLFSEDDGPSPFSHTKATWIAGWIAGKS